MLSKIPIKWLLLIAVIIIVIAFFLIILYSLINENPGDITQNIILSEQLKVLGSKIDSISTTSTLLIDKPVRLKIPVINVDASIEYVGLTSAGAMDVPKGPSDVAWFDLGPRPGEDGSAVISGHYGWKNNIPAVFDYLSKLQKGDQLYIEDENGVVTTFVVRDSRSYGERADATDVFNSSDGKAHLNLVTCEGVWNKLTKSYSKRLVVFTDRESATTTVSF